MTKDCFAHSLISSDSVDCRREAATAGLSRTTFSYLCETVGLAHEHGTSLRNEEQEEARQEAEYEAESEVAGPGA